MRLIDLPHAATSDDWYSPPWLFEAMGETFDFDVCTPPGGVPWIPCHRYYTLEDDGLSKWWDGFVWCNPPYSTPFAWCDRWARHGNGIILINADFSSVAQATALRAATSMFVSIPRLQFVNGWGEQSKAAGSFFTAVLLGAGDRADNALERLQNKGIWRRICRP